MVSLRLLKMSCCHLGCAWHTLWWHNFLECVYHKRESCRAPGHNGVFTKLQPLLCQDFKRGPKRRSIKAGFIPQKTQRIKKANTKTGHTTTVGFHAENTKSFRKLTVQKVFFQGDTSRQRSEERTSALQ